MNKDELMKVLKDYLESDEIMNQFNLANAPLLEAERENLQLLLFRAYHEIKDSSIL